LHVRKSTAAAFSSSNLNRIANTIDSILEKWIVTRLEPLFVQKNESLDMDTEMMLLTCEVICQVGFEYEMSSEEKLEMFNGLNIVLEANIRRRINPLKRTKLGLLFSDVRQARKISHRMIDLMKSILRNYRKRMQDPNDCVKKNTLAYRAINDSSYNSDDERVRDMLIFFFAGFETTAHSIAWTLLELGRNPTEQVKLREALHNWSKENGPDEDLRNCQAIKNATREGLRLHPSAPMGGFRILGEDLRISEGNVLPKGSSVGFPLFSIMRNHEIFDNPDLFCPDRWENPSKEVMEAFMPFVAGRRNCIGQSLAKSELTGVVSRLCSDYVIEIAVEGCSVNRMTMRPKGSRLKFRRLAKSDKN
jgi:cytochrome P450